MAQLDSADLAAITEIVAQTLSKLLGQPAAAAPLSAAPLAALDFESILKGCVTPKGLAKVVRIRPGVIVKWCKKGEIPGAFKLGGKLWRIPLDGFKAFLLKYNPDKPDAKPADAPPVRAESPRRPVDPKRSARLDRELGMGAFAGRRRATGR